MSKNNLFLCASRDKYRYPSPVGHINTEDLWSLPLTAQVGRPSLDDTAITLATEINNQSTGSFVNTSKSTSLTKAENSLEVVKAIIDYKQDQIQKQNDRAVKQSEIAKIQQALTTKEVETLSNMSEEELKKQLKKVQKNM